METLFQHPNLQRTLRTLPNIITGILMVVLAVMLATLFWQVLTPAKTLPSPPPAIAQTPTNVVDNKPINHGNVIANYHLFGQEQVKAPPPKPVVRKPVAAPQTPLNLDLLGILHNPSATSYAIIAPKGGKQALYSVGKEPQPGVVVHRIDAKKVVLKRNGKEEELKLPESPLNAKGTRTTSRGGNTSLPAALPSAASALPPLDAPSAQAGGANNPATAKKTDEVSGEELGLLRDAAINNPAKLLEIASVTESKDKDGNLLGFRLSPGKNRALFRQLGLRPGDVVTSVNGVQLDSPAKGINVVNELQGAASIDITVLRGGQEVSISKSF